MQRSSIETVAGAVVVAVAVLFLVFAYDSADVDAVDGYRVTAKFDRIDGIRRGSDVQMSGIKIGTVVAQALDPVSYLAVLTLAIDDSIELPEDTSAAISTDGLLGDKYVTLSPGGAEEMIAAGGEIETTQGAVDLYSLLGRAFFGQADDDAGGGIAGR